MSDSIHSRPLSDVGRENYDRIFRKKEPETGYFRGVFNPSREMGEFGAVLGHDGVIRPAGRPVNPDYHPADPVHSLTPGTIREYLSHCCGVEVIGRGICSKCHKRCNAVLTKTN